MTTENDVNDLFPAAWPPVSHACPACGEKTALGPRNTLAAHGRCPASGESYTMLNRLARKFGPDDWAVRWDADDIPCLTEGEARRRAGVFGSVINYSIVVALEDQAA